MDANAYRPCLCRARGLARADPQRLPVSARANPSTSPQCAVPAGGERAPCEPPRASEVVRRVEIAGTVFFGARDGLHGLEVWKTDGTSEGTALVKDIWPGRRGSRPEALAGFRGELFFGATDHDHGLALWRSDGTSAGTEIVKDLSRGSATGVPGLGGMTVAGDTLFFSANNGVHGRRALGERRYYRRNRDGEGYRAWA